MTKHHIVQEKYLCQWRKEGTNNGLNIFAISENKHIDGHTKWPGFWRKNYNILRDDSGTSYLPEDITVVIDSKGIEAIRKIIPQTQLLAEDRSAIAFYTALQYIRTPRNREESDKFFDATIRHYMRNTTTNLDDVRLTKQAILSEVAANECEQEALDKISTMSEDEIKTMVFEAIHGDNISIKLNDTGHSKSILKVSNQAKELFEFRWTFLIATKGTSFITSDNPCFTISHGKIMNGLLSPNSRVIFPLRPDICLFIHPKHKSHQELFLRLNKQQVRDINTLIVSHSYNAFVAKDKLHMENLLKNFDSKAHRKSRDINVYKNGDYTMFNLE